MKKTTNTKSESPWLNSDGTIKNDDEIKSISKGWSSQTWENFLKETVDVNQSSNEILSDACWFDTLPNELSFADLFSNDIELEYWPQVRCFLLVILAQHGAAF